MQGLKGVTAYFAAPEIIKEEVPKFSADIWSVICILVEMLTARWPGCHQVVRNAEAMMFLVKLRVYVCVYMCH
jgi:serine/threonine protein kinase